MSKVLMYSTSQLFGKRVTGGLKRFLELYHGLKDKGIEVDMFCGDSPEILEENDVSAQSLFTEKVSKNIFIPTELKYFLRNLKTLNKIKKRKYDLIIVFDVPTAVGLCLVGLKNINLFIRQDLVGYKKIVISERTNSKFLINGYLTLMKLCETLCLLKAKRIFVQCQYDLDALIDRHKFIKNFIKRKAIIQINNVNPSWITNNSIERKIDSRNLFYKDDSSNEFIIGFIGDFSNERKGHRILVDALKSLIDQGINIKAILVGDGKQLPTYITECRNYPSIKFTGRLENPIEVIRECDLMVVPSLADSCPNTVMEALYNDIPVIGTYSGGIPEILVHESTLFSPNPPSLENKIRYCLNKTNLNNIKLEQQSRKKDLNFNWPDVMLQHMHLL